MMKERLWLPALVLAATAYTGVGIQGPPETPSSTGPRPGRPECPHEWDFKSGQMALVGPKINVPELHDCQRFIVQTDSGLVYDSLYAIFAAAGLDKLGASLAELDSSLQGNVSLAAAEVYAEGQYPKLGIRAMFSCLYVYRDTSGWRAKMVPEGNAEQNCSQPVDPRPLPGVSLAVRRDTLPGFAFIDIPPVARWEWDPVRNEQAIGIKCGHAWCDIGRPGFTTMRAQFVSAAVSRKVRRTRMIKGWYDDQILATVTPNGDVKPSTIWGTIYPDSGLDDYDTLTVFTKGAWVHVADVAMRSLSGPAPLLNPYKGRLNLDFTAPDGPLNSIYLCRGTESQCLGDLVLVCDGDGQWWAKVVDATPGDSSPPRYRCEQRRPHEGLGDHVVGTARWRWLASDETTWKRCDNGCCELK